MSEASFWDNASHAQEVSKKASTFRITLANYEKARKLLDDAQTALELAAEDELFAQELDATME